MKIDEFIKNRLESSRKFLLKKGKELTDVGYFRGVPLSFYSKKELIQILLFVISEKNRKDKKLFDREGIEKW